MLWLALYLPQLPLEAFPCPSSPSAIVSRERIVVVDEIAATAGVTPGMRLAGAWALLPELAVQERDAERELAALPLFSSVELCKIAVNLAQARDYIQTGGSSDG